MNHVFVMVMKATYKNCLEKRHTFGFTCIQSRASPGILKAASDILKISATFFFKKFRGLIFFSKYVVVLLYATDKSCLKILYYSM